MFDRFLECYGALTIILIISIIITGVLVYLFLSPPSKDIITFRFSDEIFDCAFSNEDDNQTPVAQGLERGPYKADAAGSIPARSTEVKDV